MTWREPHFGRARVECETVPVDRHHVASTGGNLADPVSRQGVAFERDAWTTIDPGLDRADAGRVNREVEDIVRSTPILFIISTRIAAHPHMMPEIRVDAAERTSHHQLR